MPSRAKAATAAVQEFQRAYFPSRKVTARSAWLGVYEVLLWYDPESNLPHIIDANDLRRRGSPWRQRALEFQEYLAGFLSCRPREVPSNVDKLMSLPALRGKQRQNPLGKAFPAVVRFILEKFGSKRISYELDVLGTDIFPGVSIPGRSGRPWIDLLARKDGLPAAVISAKWSLRHDRLSDIIQECPVYKEIAFRTNRRRLKYYVLTNEFNPARLHKVLEDPCADGVVHIHKPALLKIAKVNSRVKKVLDLTKLIQLTNSW